MNGRDQASTSPETRSQVLGRFLRPVLLWDVAIFVTVGLACLVNPAWHSWMDVANGLVVVSAGVMALGVVGGFGGWMQTGSFDYQFSSTVDGRDAHQHAQEFLHERGGASRLIVESAAIGALPFLVAALLGRLAAPSP